MNHVQSLLCEHIFKGCPSCFCDLPKVRQLIAPAVWLQIPQGTSTQLEGYKLPWRLLF